MDEEQAVTAAPPAQRVPLRTGGMLAAIVPQDIEQVFRLARAIQVSGFAPRAYKKEEEIVVAIMHGLEVGLTPLAALQSIAVINGTPTIWGDGALALVRGSGLMSDFREWFDGETAWCEARRKDQAQPIMRSFSVDDAKRAKLWNKKGRDGQDTPWVTYPQRMLQMRARSWCLRDGFADVLRGLKMREEVQDYENAVDVTPKKQTTAGNGFRLAAPIAEATPAPITAPPPTDSAIHAGDPFAQADQETGEIVDPVSTEQPPWAKFYDEGRKAIHTLGTTGALKSWWEAHQADLMALGNLNPDMLEALKNAYRERVAALKKPAQPEPADNLGAAE